MTTFKDNFSKQSDLYLKYRPHYPVELYVYLASLTKEHDLVWDCGTGNGQAAIGLSQFYNNIIASDPSEQQIKNAIPNSKIIYRVEKAENNSIDSLSVDLLTVANALHWFDFAAFYKEAKRVLKNNGIIAAWCYGPPSISSEIDKVIMNYHNETLNDFWQDENRLVEKEYKTISFPFNEIKSPDFYCERSFNLSDFIGYLNTWSATQRFITKHEINPTEKVLEELKPLWKDPTEDKKLNWKLTLKVGTSET